MIHDKSKWSKLVTDDELHVFPFSSLEIDIQKPNRSFRVTPKTILRTYAYPSTVVQQDLPLSFKMLGNWGFWLLDVDVGFENRVFVSPLHGREIPCLGGTSIISPFIKDARLLPLAKRQLSREPPEADPTFPAKSNNNKNRRSTPHFDCVNRIQVVSHKWFRGRAGDWKATRKGSDFSSWILIWFKEHIRFRQIIDDLWSGTCWWHFG